MRINTNILSLSAQRNLATTTRALARAMEKLASGYRINSARDDAAGLAISSGLEAQRRALNQGIKNMNQAAGFLTTAEGAIAEQTNIVQRMRELALQSSNGTMGSAERSYLNTEFQQLAAEFSRLADTTEFNGVSLLNGAFDQQSIQLGNKSSDLMKISLLSTRQSDVFDLGSESTTTVSGLGTFTTSRTYSGSGFGTTNDYADIDGDGDIDIFTGERNANSIERAYINDGNGNFTDVLNTDLGRVSAVKLVDLNNDSVLDLVYGNDIDNFLSTRFGNGNGTFQAAVTYSLNFDPANGTGVFATDFNGDGFQDIIYEDEFFLGSASGTLSSSILDIGGSVLRLVTDLNGDEIDDLAMGYGGTTIRVQLGNGNGTFAPSQTASSVGNVWSPMISGDYDEDGNTDLLVPRSNGAGGYYVFYGDGNGNFGSGVLNATAAGARSEGLAFEDFDNDGHKDLFLGFENGTLQMRAGQGSGTYASAVTIASYSSSPQMHVLDFNQDGFKDLIVRASGVYDIRLQDTQSSTSEGIIPFDILTQENSEDILNVLDDGLAYLNSARSNIGALQSRLEYAESNARTMVENISAAKSQVLDTDYASELAEFTRLQILQEAGLSVLSQANISANLSLKLLQNL